MRSFRYRIQAKCSNVQPHHHFYIGHVRIPAKAPHSPNLRIHSPNRSADILPECKQHWQGIRASGSRHIESIDDLACKPSNVILCCTHLQSRETQQTGFNAGSNHEQSSVKTRDLNCLTQSGARCGETHWRWGKNQDPSPKVSGSTMESSTSDPTSSLCHEAPRAPLILPPLIATLSNIPQHSGGSRALFQVQEPPSRSQCLALTHSSSHEHHILQPGTESAMRAAKKCGSWQGK